MDNRIAEISNLKHSLIAEQNAILKNYDSFHVMCDLGISSFPKETANEQAVKHYNRIICINQDYVALNQELIQLGLSLNKIRELDKAAAN